MTLVVASPFLNNTASEGLHGSGAREAEISVD